ncbi:hypothetical protein IWQ62_004530 [Dispira parvispora]|uniref:VHS domain-containing protein n=1 Tax=Dispira parvispora TaxID=1520584 RepID=A0A9W8AKM9_9FUNG|nr:hypothetical protein IWQ62_004530 [Dispira parvispora]
MWSFKNPVKVAVDKAIVSPTEGLPKLYELTADNPKNSKKCIERLKTKLWDQKVNVMLGGLMVLNALVEKDPSRLLPMLSTPKFMAELHERLFSLATPHVVRDSIVNILDYWTYQYRSNPSIRNFELMRQRALHTLGTDRKGFVPRPWVPDVLNYGQYGAVMLAEESNLSTHFATPPQSNNLYEMVSMGNTYAQLLLDALLNLTAESPEWQKDPILIEFLPKARGLHQRLVTLASSIPPTDNEQMTMVLSAVDKLNQTFDTYNEMVEVRHLNLAKKRSMASAREPCSGTQTSDQPSTSRQGSPEQNNIASVATEESDASESGEIHLVRRISRRCAPTTSTGLVTLSRSSSGHASVHSSPDSAIASGQSVPNLSAKKQGKLPAAPDVKALANDS